MPFDSVRFGPSYHEKPWAFYLGLRAGGNYREVRGGDWNNILYNAYQRIRGGIVSKTLGEEISKKRKEKKWSLRELAERVQKEDGSPISPQYLNDIEHGNRKPSGPLIDNLAKALDLDQDYLRILSGAQPAEMNDHPEVVAEMVKAYRRHLKGDANALKSIPARIKEIEEAE